MPTDLGMLTVGVDLGGTKIEVALVNVAGRVLMSDRSPTEPDKGSDIVIANVVAAVKRCLRKGGRISQLLGVGVAGQVCKETGDVVSAPNLDWCNVRLQAKLENALGLKVVVTNDVRAATFAEWKYGAGQGLNDLVCVSVGTGVGGGVVSSGRLIEGVNYTAGELGHMTIVSEGRRCRCLNKGCLEAYAGGWAIAERAQEAVRADPIAGKMLVSLAGAVQKISANTVARARLDRDPLAIQIVEETAQYLAAGVVSIVNAFGPSVVVLGGGVLIGLPEIIPIVAKRVRSSALDAAVQHLCIVKTSLADKAGVIGAARMALDSIHVS